MSDQLMITLQTALQQLALQHTVEMLGDRTTYLGASDIGTCPRKTILSKLKTPEADLVTRIRMRATTIRDFDSKELLVPNKEFISGRLLNWSLTDSVTRIMIPVGLAYGGDVQKAMALMVEAAKENSMVLEDPVPITTFDSFGDNALLLTLRCFIGSVDYRIPAQSDLHKAIDQKFREAELSMAFPQRDIHLDPSKPFAIRILKENIPSQDKYPSGTEG